MRMASFVETMPTWFSLWSIRRIGEIRI